MTTRKVAKEEFVNKFNELNGTMKAKEVHDTLAEIYQVTSNKIKEICKAQGLVCKKYFEKQGLELVDEVVTETE